MKKHDLKKKEQRKFGGFKIKQYLCIRKNASSVGPFVYRLGREIFIL